MQIITESIDDILIVVIEGRIDSLNARKLERALFSPISKGNKKLVIDFSKLTYISSVGLRILMEATKRIREIEGILVLSSAGEQVRQVLEVSGFSRLISTAETVDDAIEKCNTLKSS